MGIFRKAWRGIKSVFGRKKRRNPKRRALYKRKAVRQTGHLTVKKTVIDDKIAVGANTTSFGVDTFELSDIPQYGSYINLYEEYRIDKIVYSFKSLNNVASPPGATNFVSTLGMIHTTVDYNDAVSPTTIQNMMNDSSYRGSRSSKNHTRQIRPCFMNDVGGNVANQQKRGWLTCYAADGVTVSTVSHYGIKWAFEGGIASALINSFYVEPIITYYISFRNPK